MKWKQGNVVIVAGAASGLGKLLSQRLNAEGMLLVVADINETARGEAERELRDAGATVTGVATDVSDLASCRGLVDTATKAYGRIDALVNCAGLVRPGRFADADPADDELMIRVNLCGNINVSRAVLPVLQEQNFGHIVHVASLAGRSPVPGEAIYCASKFGVRGFSLTLGLELRKTPIKVSLVCPDSFNSPSLAEEAGTMAAPLSFSGPILEVDTVVDGVIKALKTEKPEVCVPGNRGFLTALLDLLPFLRRPLVDRLEKEGVKRLQAMARDRLAAGGVPK